FVAFTIWALLHGLEGIGILRRLIVAPLALMGQVAFMLYFVHHLIGYRLLYHLGIVTGRSWYGQFGTLDPTQALIGLLLMIVLCCLVSVPWLRVRKQVEAETLGRVPGFRALRRT
ncbi:MAG: hypothetical protein H7175_19320, partial [Burkholderiales bacterium]|nr:hypothetical protein [Anaerolineae bacterium]